MEDVLEPQQDYASMIDEIRLCVCVPSHGDWKAGFGLSLAMMVKYFQDSIIRKPDGTPFKKDINVATTGGSMLPEVRHRLVAEAMKWDATHMLFLDADMLFPPWTANQLLMRGVPIVGANYPRRSMPPIPTAYVGERGSGNGHMLYTEPGDRGLVEVKHVGTGVMLIDMNVFDYLDHKAQERGEPHGLPYFTFEVAADKCGLIGEDVYFCEKCRSEGLPVYCDQELSQEVAHIGEHFYTHRMSLAARDEAERLKAKEEAAATAGENSAA